MRDLRSELAVIDAIAAPDLWPDATRRASGPAEPKAAGWLAYLTPRLGWLAGFATALAVLAVIVFGSLGAERSAAALISQAQDRFAQIPPFRAKVVIEMAGALLQDENPDYSGADIRITREISYRGPDGWRRATLTESPPGVVDGGGGSFWVWDGNLLGTYRSDTNEFYTQNTTAGLDPLGSLSWNFWRSRCADGIVHRNETVAGRDAWRLECDEAQAWVDAETGLVLKSVWNGTSETVVMVDYGATLEPSLFLTTPPPGAGTGPTISERPSLTLGTAAPGWNLPLLDGGTLALSDLRGSRAVIYVWAEWCPCLDVYDLLQKLSLASPDDVQFITVAMSSSHEGIAEILAREGAQLRVVMDDGTIQTEWGIEPVPVLIVLDSSGQVLEVAVGGEVRHALERIIAELEITPG